MSEKTRVFAVVSFYVNDNDEPVTDIEPMAFTKSSEVATEVLQCLIKRRGPRTKVWEAVTRNLLPGCFPDNEKFSGLVGEILSPSEYQTQLTSEPTELSKSLLDEIAENS